MAKTLRLAWLTLAGLILIIILFLAAYNGRQRVSATTFDPPRKLDSSSSEFNTSAGSLRLSQLNGKLVILNIGYTNCPNYCPTTLANLRRVMELLDPSQAEQVQVFFVSVDPARDTPEKLAGYMSAFNPNFIGATASPAVLDLLATETGSYYKLDQPDAAGYYTVEHSTNTLLLDRAGRLRASWSYGTEPAQIAADLRLLLVEK